jgi:hypothetical protein
MFCIDDRQFISMQTHWNSIFSLAFKYLDKSQEPADVAHVDSTVDQDGGDNYSMASTTYTNASFVTATTDWYVYSTVGGRGSRQPDYLTTQKASSFPSLLNLYNQPMAEEPVRPVRLTCTTKL